jgi:hypothetical protein
MFDAVRLSQDKKAVKGWHRAFNSALEVNHVTV